MRDRASRLIPILALVLAGPVPALAGPQADSTSQPPQLSYANPQFHWSVSYPADWKLNSTDESSVSIRSPDAQCMCGIHSGPAPFKSTDSFTKNILDFTRKRTRGDGLKFVILSQRKLALSNGLVVNDVLSEIRPGGKSRRVLAMVDGIGFVIDCETYAKNWIANESSFDGIIRSFVLND